jgi:hypothetical protein
MGHGIRIWKITFHGMVATCIPLEDLHPEHLDLQKHLELNLRVRYHVNRWRDLRGLCVDSKN